MQTLAATLDLLARGGALTALALTAPLFLRPGPGRRRRLPVPCLALGLCAYLLVSSPHIGLGGTAAAPVLIALASAVPPLSVWAGAELFLDRPNHRPDWRPWHIGVGGLVLGAAWLAPVLPQAAILRGALVLLCYGGLLFIALATAAGDLVEPRRRFRRWFVALMALTGLAISIVEVLGLDDSLPALAYPLHALVFLGLTVLFLLATLRPGADLWDDPPAAALLHPPSSAPDLGSDPAPDPTLSAAAAAVLRRVEAAMAAGIWRQEGLSIAALSAAAEAPEHRVRRAINQGLGHRNFASYVNAARIRAACALLSDPARADLPVLSIAYDTGFASLGPFNRAFRTITGQSPTEYRKTHCEKAIPT